MTAGTAIAAETVSRRAPLGRRSPVPLYHRLYLILRDKILTGAYGDGALMPSEAELVERFGVSRITAKRALDDLAAEGLVARRRGRGTMVTHRYRPRALQAPLGSLLSDIESMAARTDAELIDWGFEPAPPAIAERLDLGPDRQVLRLVRRRVADGVPFALLTSHTVAAAARGFSPGDLEGTARLTLFRRCGITVARARQTVTAILADAVMAEHLDVAAGAALLQLDRTLIDAAGRAFDHLCARYRPDRFQIRMDLTRDRGLGAAWRPDAEPAPGD